MGCAPISVRPLDTSDDTELLAIALARENSLRDFRRPGSPVGMSDFTLGVANPLWVQHPPVDTMLPPAYSKEVPQGHVSYADEHPERVSGIRQVNVTTGTSPALQADTRCGAAGVAPRVQRVAAHENSSDTSAPYNRSPASSSNRVTSTPHDPQDFPVPHLTPRWPRTSRRARRRISPMPLSSPSHSSMRGTDDSEAMVVLQSMTRPTSSGHTRTQTTHSPSSNANGSAVTSGSQDGGSSNAGWSPVTTVTPFSATQSRVASHSTLRDACSVPGSTILVHDHGATNETDGVPQTAGLEGVELLSDRVDNLQLDARSRGSHDSANSLRGQSTTTSTPPGTGTPTGQEKGRQSQGDRKPGRHGARYELFPQTQSRISVAEQPAPWHGEILAVGKRSRSWRSSSSIHLHSRRSRRSNSAGEAVATGLHGPSSCVSMEEPNRLPTIPVAKHCIRAESTWSGKSTHQGSLGSGNLEERIDVAPALALRPIRRRDPRRLPPLDPPQHALPVVTSG